MSADAGPNAGQITPDHRRRVRSYVMLLAIAAAVVVQATLLSRVRIQGAQPNLALVLLVSWSMQQGVREGIVGAFLAGLGLDLIAGMPLGTSSLALMFACLLGGIGTRSVFGNNILLPLLAVGLATPLHGWVVLFTQQLQGQDIDWIATTVRVIGPELILNEVMVPIVYPLLRSTGRALGASRMEW